MKNYVQDGKTVTLTAPYAVLSGGGCFLTSLFGIAVSDVGNGAAGEFQTSGVFDITALSTDTFAVGDKAYWDDTNKRITSTASGNKLVGAALGVKASGDTTARIRLDGVVI